ncbi:hypothetical protein TEA_027691 [Camellia sinensis var. sinensis]|uniref:Protein kinase domain-containing protein n=1 Tax=Camellia sinensis var. sinensis TaxID=542762 RepID=A0A4S4EML7_CAMSN|nr:hypothetical protein TEA_027691 [Camellia sinensis var. sinensis]
MPVYQALAGRVWCLIFSAQSVLQALAGRSRWVKSGSQLVTPRLESTDAVMTPQRNRQIQRQRSLAKLASNHNSYSSGTTKEDWSLRKQSNAAFVMCQTLNNGSFSSGYTKFMNLNFILHMEFSCESWSSSSRRVTGTPIKKLLVEEMSKETESKRHPQSVIARLMGLDGLPPPQPLHRQHKGLLKRWKMSPKVEEFWSSCSRDGWKDSIRISSRSRSFATSSVTSTNCSIRKVLSPIYSGHEFGNGAVPNYAYYSIYYKPRNGSPPWRLDDKDGHFVFAIRENLTTCYRILSKMGEVVVQIRNWFDYRKSYLYLHEFTPEFNTDLKPENIPSCFIRICLKVPDYTVLDGTILVTCERGCILVNFCSVKARIKKIQLEPVHFQCGDQSLIRWRPVKRYVPSWLRNISEECTLWIGQGCKLPKEYEGIWITPATDRILSKMGEGTFGQVLECLDNERKEIVAIKIVRSINKYREAAMIEIDVLQKLSRHDIGGTRCVQIRNWFDYLMHDLHLIHTDLKPENILLVSSEYVKVPDYKLLSRSTKDGSFFNNLPKSSAIKLIDFGSTTFEHEDHTYVASTRQYCAPEVILGLGWNYPCDLWSVGCILVELCSGETLFEAHENLEHLAVIERVLGPLPQHMIITFVLRNISRGVHAWIGQRVQAPKKV